MAKDFFDEEYEKQQDKQKEAHGNNGWYDHPAPAQTTQKKSLYIVLLCFALIACIALGFVSCALIEGTLGQSNVNEETKILDSVITYLKNNYYMDISEEELASAIEKSGSALMQNAGDRFCMLMSPQTYYDFVNPTASLSADDESFGVTFTLQDKVGLFVSSVTADMPAYGQLYKGDLVLKIGDIRTKTGEVPVLNGVPFEEMTISQLTLSTISDIYDVTYSATFYGLREDPSAEMGFSTFSVHLTRAHALKVSAEYNFNFVEYYFGRNHSNVSTDINKPAGAVTTTEKERRLDLLPADTGYIRLKEFSDHMVLENGQYVLRSASYEFKQAMTLFKQLNLKHLVLDIKGNPGGELQYVSEIASMLVTDGHLTDAQKSQVVNSNGELLITYIVVPKPTIMRENQYMASSYGNYFGTVKDVCDIAVWTDASSASASELLTGCLRDYGTAVQMGTTTYGKGIAQTWTELPFKGNVIDIYGNTIEYPWAVYYTCASYYSPFGTNIHNIGYTPDAPYNGLSSYEQLWQAVGNYWG